MNRTTKSQFQIGLVIIVIAAIVGLCNECLGQKIYDKRTLFDKDEVCLGMNETDFKKWSTAKQIQFDTNLLSYSTDTVKPKSYWREDFYYLRKNPKPTKGALVDSRYIKKEYRFKNGTCYEIVFYYEMSEREEMKALLNNLYKFENSDSVGPTGELLNKTLFTKKSIYKADAYNVELTTIKKDKIYDYVLFRQN